MNLTKAFDIFNNTTARIVEHGNYNSFSNSHEEINLGEITGDLQAYGGDLAEKEYGFKEECQYQFFCDKNENVKAGNYLVIGSKSYKIVYTASWGIGLEVLLKEV